MNDEDINDIWRQFRENHERHMERYRHLAESPVAVTFTLTENQMERANAFIADHGCTIPVGQFGKEVGAIGGEIAYCFSPTGLGNIQIVKCSCGAELNLTDFELW